MSTSTRIPMRTTARLVWSIWVVVGVVALAADEQTGASDETAQDWLQRHLIQGGLGTLVTDEENGAPEAKKIPMVLVGDSVTVSPTACGPRSQVIAVRAAQDWLVRHQLPDGGWSFNHHLCPDCDGKCRNPGQLDESARNAATGLSLLALMGGGNAHKEGPHQESVKKGIRYLIGRMNVTEHGGSFHESGGRMYSQGIATLALCELYHMSGQKKLRQPARQAVDFIVYAQDPVGGGWRYMPRQRGDTSVSGWQIAALRSAQLAGLNVPDETMAGAAHFLDQVQSDGGARYGYTTPGAGSATTAIGLLSRIHLGGTPDDAAFQRGADWLLEQGPSEDNAYFNFHASQVLHHRRDRQQVEWDKGLRNHLVESQQTEGHERGSWSPGHEASGSRAGRLYQTAMSLLTLEVYYRHLPIWEIPAEQ